jgi:transcriptional regulator with XRE-family HTH domain
MTHGEYLTEMGKKIRIARRIKKLTLHKVAAQCNVDIHTICYIERGKTNPHILILKSIADVLKVDLKDFL